MHSGPTVCSRALTLAGLLLLLSPQSCFTAQAAGEPHSIAPQLHAALLPTRATYRATYRKGIPIPGSAIRELTPLPNGQWNYRFEVRSLIVDITENVTLDWAGGKLRPHLYTYDRDGWRMDRKGSVTFNWEAMTVLNDIGNYPWTMQIPQGALDKLGYQLQLRMDLQAGHRQMTYFIADGGKLKQTRFAVVGEEILDTEHGQVSTVIVERTPQKGNKRQSRLWMAINWHYLLVRMKQKEADGETYEIFLQSATIGDLRIGKP